ncbi:hypothetical protein Q3G72_033724 [Acer saccharum]|nr:hypothetical protein Q3G72_033724 [Acer saccharum]
MKQVERLSPCQSQILLIGLARAAVMVIRKVMMTLILENDNNKDPLLKGFSMNGMIIPLPLRKVYRRKDATVEEQQTEGTIDVNMGAQILQSWDHNVSIFALIVKLIVTDFAIMGSQS